MANWADIPCVTLLEIMQYLPRQDRLSCGLVCKSWYMSMTNPMLWKNLQVCLDTDLTDPLTIIATKRYSTHIKRLDLAWSKPYLPRRWIRNRMTIVAHDTCEYLSALKDLNIDLTHFKLTDWYFTWKFKRVIFYLSMFLKQQRFLQCIDLNNAYLNKAEILKILMACRTSCLTVTYLNLHCAFHEWHNVFSNVNFITAMQPFNKLEVLKIDYSSLSDKVLMIFVQNGTCSLRLIEIYVRDVDSRSHVISANTWKRLSFSCQKLKVALHFLNVCHYEDIHYILIDTIPLEIFSLSCGHVWDQSRTRNYCDTLNLLINNFAKSLTQVTLLLRNNREMVDYYLHRMLMKCNKLQYLEFDGVLRNMDLIRGVCLMQCETNECEEDSRSQFKFFHMRPKHASVYNNLVISEIWRRYSKQMHKKNVDFQIESFNNTAIFISIMSDTANTEFGDATSAIAGDATGEATTDGTVDKATPSSDTIEPNTYNIKPSLQDKFKVMVVREIIRNVLTEELSGKTYTVQDAKKWTIQISNIISSKVRDMKWKRYKHVVQVVIGEQRGAGVKSGVKCVWDSETDNYASDVFINVSNKCGFQESLFCMAVVFAVYYY